MGPMTGGGFGPCAGGARIGMAGAAMPFRGRGGGWGRGGRGYRNIYRATGLTGWQRGGWYGAQEGLGGVLDPTDEVRALRTWVENQEKAIQGARARLEALEHDRSEAGEPDADQ